MATCSEEEVHYNDIGTEFLVTIKDCVSGTPTVLDVPGRQPWSLFLSHLLVYQLPRVRVWSRMVQTEKSNTQLLTVTSTKSELGDYRQK